MTDEWHPRIGRPRLSGVSAHRLSKIGSGFLWPGMACLVLTMVLLWGLDQPLLAGLVAVPGLVGVLTGRIVLSVAGTRELREYAAGYATRVRGEESVDVEHVDPRTGRLVSFAGEDLTGAERRSRVEAVRAHARLGAGEPERLPSAVDGDAAVGDDALFDRHPRTFVTLHWTVRQGVLLGLVAVVLVPLGLVAVVFIAPEPEAAVRSVGPIVDGVVAAVAALGAVVLVVSLRRTDAVLGEGEGPITKRTVLSIWIMVFVMALAMAGGFVYSSVENGRLARVESDGVRAMAYDAEVRVVSASRVTVRAVVDYPDGPRQVQLNYDQNPHPISSRSGWMPAPVPYDDTFTVLYDPDDPDFLVAEIDIADTDLGVMEAELGRAAALSALWGTPWFVAWIVMVLRAARDGRPGRR